MLGGVTDAGLAGRSGRSHADGDADGRWLGTRVGRRTESVAVTMTRTADSTSPSILLGEEEAVRELEDRFWAAETVRGGLAQLRPLSRSCSSLFAEAERDTLSLSGSVHAGRNE